MIFKVSDEFKGSLVLTSINKVVWAGMQISVEGNDLYFPDVKKAVKKGILLPFVEGEYDDLYEINHQVRIINKTDKSLALGEFILHPKASLLIDRTFAESAIIQRAEADELIELKYEKVKSVAKKTISKKVKKVDSKKDQEQEPKQKSQKTIAKIWDLRDQEIKNVEMASHSAEQKIVETNPENKEEIKKSVKKNSTLKNAKKKDNKTNKRNSNIKPVGEVKKQEGNVAVELDSRGDPIEKPSKVLEDMINKLSSNDEISFVDKEQEIKRLEKRRQLDEE